MDHLRHHLGNLARYAVVFVPLRFVLGFLEGGLRGEWPLSGASLRYQLAGWLAAELGPLLLAAPLVLAGLHLASGHGGPVGPSARARRLRAVGWAPVMVAGAGMLLSWSLVLPAFPLSFALAGAAFGAVARLP